MNTCIIHTNTFDAIITSELPEHANIHISCSCQ